MSRRRHCNLFIGDKYHDCLWMPAGGVSRRHWSLEGMVSVSKLLVASLSSMPLGVDPSEGGLYIPLLLQSLFQPRFFPSTLTIFASFGSIHGLYFVW